MFAAGSTKTGGNVNARRNVDKETLRVGSDPVFGFQPKLTDAYVYASYIDEPVMRAGGSGDRYLHRNQQYSIVALTDSTGAIKERYSYDAYGTPTIADASGVVRTASAEDNRYTYTGREYDESLDLYHYRARMYDSISGRFISRDPICSITRVHYAYVRSAPTRYLDWSGCAEQDPNLDILTSGFWDRIWAAFGDRANANNCIGVSRQEIEGLFHMLGLLFPGSELTFPDRCDRGCVGLCEFIQGCGAIDPQERIPPEIPGTACWPIKREGKYIPGEIERLKKKVKCPEHAPNPFWFIVEGNKDLPDPPPGKPYPPIGPGQPSTLPYEDGNPHFNYVSMIGDKYCVWMNGSIHGPRGEAGQIFRICKSKDGKRPACGTPDYKQAMLCVTCRKCKTN